MRNNWEIKLLKDVCKVFVDGNWIESKDQSESGIRLVQTGNIGFGYFKDKEDKSRFISEDTFNRLKCTEILPGDLLVSRLPDPVGKSCIIPDIKSKMITGVDCTIIRTKDFITPEYLCYYQQSNEYLGAVLERVSGTTRSRISRKNLGVIPIPIPPLQQQKQIVAILDEAFDATDQAKANIEKNLQNAKELFQSKLNEIFTTNAEGWEQKRLQDVALEFGRGKSKHRPRNDAKLFGGNYPFVQTGDVRNVEKFITEFSQTYNEIGLAQSKLWPKGTICITIAANIAETAILEFDACFPDSIIGLIVDESKASRDFSFYALQFLKSELQAKGKGSAQDNINLGTFQSQYFPFPDLLIQERMVQILDEIKNKCTLIENSYMKKLESLDELKKSILQKAFDGELTNKSVMA